MQKYIYLSKILKNGEYDSALRYVENNIKKTAMMKRCTSQFHYTKWIRFMPFLLAEILNFQGSTHRTGVGSFSK
mgnify:CR=1 FL=1